MREIKCTRWLIGRLHGFVCTSWVVRWRGGECKLGGDGWCTCECVGRQKGVCGSCLIRVSSMHYIKSIRMFENFEEWFPSLGYLRILISALPVYLISLTVNVLGLLFL